MHREGRAAAELPCWKARSRTNWSKSAALLWRPGSFCLFFPPLHLPAKSMQGFRELMNGSKPTVSRFPRSLLWLQLAVQTSHGCVRPLLLQTPRPIPFSCCQHQSEALFALRGPFAGSDTQLWSLFVLVLGKPL